MVAGYSLHGRTAKRKGRGDTGSIRLLLVGTNNKRAGTLHGRSDTGDSGADEVRRSNKNMERLPT